MTTLIKVSETGKLLGVVHNPGSPEVIALYAADGYQEGTPPDDESKLFVAGEWVFSIDVARVSAKQRITRARNAEESGGFTAYGKLFDSDEKAIQRISVGVQAAQVIGAAFSTEWTCKDNSTITLDSTQMEALPVFMAMAANTLHVKARDLKAQIEAATTLEEIEAVVW